MAETETVFEDYGAWPTCTIDDTDSILHVRGSNFAGTWSNVSSVTCTIEPDQLVPCQIRSHAMQCYLLAHSQDSLGPPSRRGSKHCPKTRS